MIFFQSVSTVAHSSASFLAVGEFECYNIEYLIVIVKCKFRCVMQKETRNSFECF